jgi:DHA2 family multidrug resistance protein
MGCIFVPLQTLALHTIPPHQMGNATAAFNMVRNIGGGIGVAFATAMLARRSQVHQSTLAEHVDVWSVETAERLRGWAGHFWAHGADTFTAERRALAMLYRDTVGQAQVLAYADDFRLISVLYWALLALILAMHRVGGGESEREARSGGRGSAAVAAE